MSFVTAHLPTQERGSQRFHLLRDCFIIRKMCSKIYPINYNFKKLQSLLTPSIFREEREAKERGQEERMEGEIKAR